MFVNSEFEDLLRHLNDSGARYLIIGGYAVIQYAEPRFTQDLDVWIATDRENATRVYEALVAFGAPLAGMTPRDFEREGFFYQMGSPPVRVDIMMGIPGVAFDEAWGRRETFQFEDLPVPFVSIEDLISSKIASGRPQDLLDVTRLKASQKKGRRPSAK